MLDVDEQLTRLRQRIAVIDRKFAEAKRVDPAPARPRQPIEEWADGRVVSNEFGEHFQTEKLFPSRRLHGSVDIGALNELPPSFLAALSESQIGESHPSRWAFLDTETTGLAGGSGTYAFLIGVGQITPEGFALRQYFMREYAEERSLLFALEQQLQEFDVLITYNGRSYDQPLLETRFRMNRHKHPFARLEHLDLLYGARRLWKLHLENCRLMQLERDILGFEREGDLPGELIPYVYFEYLRSREALKLVPVFHHNAMDILTLACLTAIVPAAFHSTDTVFRGAELIGLGRWLRQAGEHEKALTLFKRAIETRLPDRHLFRTLWDIACLEKKLGRHHETLRIHTELAGCHNECRIPALEELAKFYEHREKNYALALDFTAQALVLNPTEELIKRHQRLEKKLSRPRSRPLPLQRNTLSSSL
jgi:uncharacterized protein